MKKTLITVCILCSSLIPLAQERLLSISKTKNYVSPDSVNMAFSVDLNRVPGSTEKTGGTFFVNEPIKSSQFGFYWKPTADINLGTGTTSAPNNISVGTPIGFTWDRIRFSELGIEMGPEFVSDRDFNNYLLYYSVGPYFRYEYLKRHILLNFTTGLNFSFGKRMYSDKLKHKTAYQRTTFPLFAKLELWQDSAGKRADRKAFRRIHITQTFKFNKLNKDNDLITPDKSLFYTNTKLDFYIIPRIAVSLNYIRGYEEPIFKKVHSLSFGLTFSRF